MSNEIALALISGGLIGLVLGFSVSFAGLRYWIKHTLAACLVLLKQQNSYDDKPGIEVRKVSTQELIDLLGGDGNDSNNNNFHWGINGLEKCRIFMWNMW